MAKNRTARDRACALKELLVELGRARSLRDPMAEMAKNLTPPQIHTLMWLHEDGVLPITALAQRVHCAAPTITGVIDRLERDALVERKRDEEDRRVVLVALTGSGARIAQKLNDALIEQLAMLFHALTPADGDALIKIARRLVDRVGDRAQALARASVTKTRANNRRAAPGSRRAGAATS